MKKRILILTAALCLLLPLAACGQEETTTEPDTIPVETATVTRGTISSEHSVSGQVASGDQQSVFVAVSARCTNVAVEVGDPVVAGQVICTLDMAATWSSYETARMSYESAQQSYADQSAVLEQQLALAEKNVTDTEGVLSGMFADVVFYTDAQEDTIIVPTEAIQTDGDGSFVFTVDGKDTAHRVAVQTGLVGDGVTEITSGLVGGETLVTVGQAYLKDGTLVRIVPGGA